MTNTVLIKRSGTANSVPTAGQLQQGELAINYADGNLFYKNSSNAVTLLTSNQFVSVAGNVTGGNLLTVGQISATGTISSTGSTLGTAFAVGNGAVSNVGLGFFPTAGTPGEYAIRDYSTVFTNMYFDVGIGGSVNGAFRFRSSNAFTTLANINSTGVTTSLAVSATGNITGGNVITTGSVYGVELWSTNSVGSEGGQINLSLPASGSTLSGGVIIDVFNNQLRFYERTGTNRGAYIDLTTATAGVGSNLLAGGGSTPTQIVNGTSNVVVTSSGNVTVGVAGTATVATFTTAGIVANSVSATNNGAGTNFKVGDDAWIGDVNNADTMSVRGQQNAANGYIVFGNADSTSTLGRAGSGPLTYLGAFSATGNITGNYFIGNGSQLTGIASGSSSNISNGTSNVNINSSGGNISFSVGGTANVVTLDNAGFNFLDTTTQDTGINLGRIQTSVQGWNLP